MCHSSGSIYEPLKLSILQREDEPLWEKLDRYYNAGEYTNPQWTAFSITFSKSFYIEAIYHASTYERKRLMPRMTEFQCGLSSDMQTHPQKKGMQ